ncbi:HAD family hydrolase [Streptomyces cinereoruber]|uniref:HAD family hydrolase n=1 Tax=Streptomyces cinereoruber TaxID=67260 RepID=UPI003630C059
MSQNPARAAFFDVDGTLTTSAGMFRFLAYYLAATGRPRREYDERMREFKAMTAVGCPREATNRAYFAHLQGLDAGVVADVARAWFAAELATGAHYHRPALTELRRHQERGDHVVLVSGSFPALLAPLAADLGVDDIRCTRPRIDHGRYTGALDGPPMIGAAKSDAVMHVTIRAGIDPADCTAYGDHVSDLPMLNAVGTAYVVGGDAGLRSAARLRGWRFLPGTPPAPEPPLPHRGADRAAAFPPPRTPFFPTPRDRDLTTAHTTARYETREGA